MQHDSVADAGIHCGIVPTAGKVTTWRSQRLLANVGSQHGNTVRIAIEDEKVAQIQRW